MKRTVLREIINFARLNPMRISAVIAVGFVVGVIILTIMDGAWQYAAPAYNMNATMASDGFIEGPYIKVPASIDRKRDCLTTSTILLRRSHEYPPPIGFREDLVTIGGFNTSLTPIGRTDVMLWFLIPAYLPPGEWSYVARIQDDCHSWLDAVLKHPFTRPETVKRIVIP